MELLIKNSSDAIPKKEIKSSEQEVIRAYKSLKRVNDLFLNTIQRERAEELNLIKTTRNIIQVYMAQHMEIAVDFDYDHSREWRLRIPPFPYEQALKNVLLNAAYHLQDLPYAKIDLHFRMDAKSFYITITDNGRGMHRSTMEDLFRPRTSKKKGGRGMGLYLSRIMLESIGGGIRCTESYLYWGSTFEIRLPIITEGVTHG